MPSPPSPPHDDDVYAQLIAALHPSPPALLEIEILPSSFPPQILLHESSAVGVPKSLLTPLYLQARRIFFDDHVSSRAPESYHAALQATAIILLFDPNHLTAANFRKRHIQRCFSRERTDNDHDGRDAGKLAVQHELKFLESLVTSPLSKHAKSSTLWAQRLWIVENFFRSAMREHATDEAIQMMDMRQGIKSFWDVELMVVMKAGERHPRNYYAWQYARQLFSFVRSERPELVERRQWGRRLLSDSIGLVRGWCLMHPRDISGWAFLVFLLEQLRDEGCDDEDMEKGFEDEIGLSVSETREFARKYEWKGESIEWFLRTMNMLDIDN